MKLRLRVEKKKAPASAGDPLAAWHSALEPQLAACRSYLVARAWQRLVEGKMADAWTRLLRQADALPHVAYLTEQAEKGEPGGFVQVLTLEQLPGYFKKLIGPYELRVYWFEVFECVRKVALVGLPVFFMPGTLEQLILGLLICFLSFGAYMLLSPYLEERHDHVSRLCQVQIFFALLAGIVLKAEPSESTTDNFGLILTFMCAVPPLCVAFLATPLSQYIIDATARTKALGMITACCRALRRCGAGSDRPARVAPAPPGRLSHALSSRSSMRRRDPTNSVCPECAGWTGRADGKAPRCTDPDCPGARDPKSLAHPKQDRGERRAAPPTSTVSASADDVTDFDALASV